MKTKVYMSILMMLCIAVSAQATHFVFDGSYQNTWGGVSTTDFGGETVVNATTSGTWGWKNMYASSGQDLSAESYWEWDVYCASSGGGDQLGWYFVSPSGQEWNESYKFNSGCSVDGVPTSLPTTLSTDTWHAIKFDMAAKSWWSGDSDSIQYLKWQFPEQGTYYIRNVRFTGGNGAPQVDAGSNTSITLPTNSVSLDGTVSDDGLPDPPGTVTQTWTKQSGPGTVTFGNASAVDTTATFSTSGVYVLRLTASDSALQNYDEVTITVNPEPGAGPPISNISTNASSYPSSEIPAYSKFEITFDVDTDASNVQLPYDDSPPTGITPKVGISVDAQFTPDNWVTTYTQPAFYYQYFDHQIRSNNDWIYPQSNYAWKVRFAPPTAGSWKFKIVAEDEDGVSQSSDYNFTVVSSNSPGFIRVSAVDERYFEYENGDPFYGLGHNFTWGFLSWDEPSDSNSVFQTVSGYGMSYFRLWINNWGIYGGVSGAWNSPDPALHGQYYPYQALSMDVSTPEVDSDVCMKLRYDACPVMWLGHMKDAPAVKQSTDYAIFVEYRIDTALTGPRGSGSYGLVCKTSTWNDYLYNSGEGTVVSDYAYQATSGWTTLTGSFNSGSNGWIPGGYFSLCLENVNTGAVAYINKVEIREDLGGGQYGPNIVNHYWMSKHLYFDQKYSYAFDKVLEYAEDYGILFQLCLMEKNCWIMNRINDSGVNDPNNPSNNYFYGYWTLTTKNRWLQQAFWRYCQARWGYSTSIGAWELLNEGDPLHGRHWTQTDEFGKYMQQFTPDNHITSTSTWGGFPCEEFWGNDAEYPDVDYADYHKYPAGVTDIAAEINSYNMSYGAKESGGAGKPLVLGETGYYEECEDDTDAIWYHNYVWANINHGGMYQLYWCENGEFDWTPDPRAHNKPYANFIDAMPLNNGHYEALSPTINGSNIRAFGQKDLTNENAHVWIQNDEHTFYNIINSNPVGSVTGTIEIGGFTPSATYDLEWWDPYEAVKANQIISSTQVNANGSGVITLSVSSLVDDIAAKISATTEDTTPPTPNPSTWATVPYAAGPSSVSMTATTTSDPSGVQYYFDCTAGAGGHDSGWQSSSSYTDTGLNDLTQYSYRVRARDMSTNYNETGWSTTQSATTQDGTAPTPNPMTWATVPYATGTTSISMTATTASDVSGVQYYFECTAGGGHNSGWQSGTTYQDTGLNPSTQYFYRVRARDMSSNYNQTSWSTTQSATTDTLPDTTAPTPNPLTWSTVPYSTGTTSISMTATTASDPSGVEYFFDCTAGGGHDSGWQDSTTYQDTGLSPSTQYTYRVQARDKSVNQNAGGWSTSESATTDSITDTTPPAPDPMTWATEPYSTGTTTISMTATTATDPSGVEYYFDCTAGGGHDSGWQDSIQYTDTGLSPNTQYTYQVSARDKSANQNQTAWSTTKSATTDATSSWTDGWRMAGANPQRTSWVPEDVSGRRYLEWYKPFEPMIAHKVQIVAANNLLYVSTTRGLYALNASTGAGVWVYPTELPLGHSPTVINGVAYVGCFDRRVHAINASTGEGIWTSLPAGAGFDVSPLVVEGKVVAGSRDGTLYCFEASTGDTLWTHPTDLKQPICFSCAYKDGIVYFAANDMRAYAVNISTGERVWKSAKLPGAGFYSWWPVVHGNYVVFTGSSNWREGGTPSTSGGLHQLEDTDIFGSLANESGYGGAVVSSSPLVLDFSEESDPEGNGPITEYLRTKPWRRTYFLLKVADGNEVMYDFNDDDQMEYAPHAYMGTHSGSRTPPVVGNDGYEYILTGGVLGSPYISRGAICRWELDSSQVRVFSNIAHDEPTILAGGGNQIHYYHGEYRDGTQGSVNITTGQNNSYYWYIWTVVDDLMDYLRCRPNDMYGIHGDQNPGIPYNGKVYNQRWGYVMCWSGTESKTELSQAQIATPGPSASVPTVEALRTRLAEELQKMIDAGHLRSGWLNRGLASNGLEQTVSDSFDDYFSLPGETICVLCRALSHLPTEMQQDTMDYIADEFSSYPPDVYAHIGWQGAAREAEDIPPEYTLSNYGPRTSASQRVSSLYTFPPQANYALYQYAKVFGNASSLVNRLRSLSPPSDATLIEYPWAHNAYIAGYAGIVGLKGLAGQTDPTAEAELNRLLQLRANNFSVNYRSAPPSGTQTLGTSGQLTIMRNFMYMTPELADYLRNNILSTVQAAWTEYNTVHPFWLISRACEGTSENVLCPLWDYHCLFQAKAQILQDSYEELVKYLDVPAYWRGDLYYIDNLCAALEAADTEDYTAPTPDPMTWASVPTSTGSSSIAMTATVASDPSGVEYYFECMAGAGGHDSGWQSGVSYEDTGLNPSTQYTYRVRARDKSTNQNTGSWSTAESATTGPLADTTPPTPNPLTWATVPYATGSASISMTATTASDPSGVEYYFDSTAGAGGHDSGWQDSATYQDTGLSAGTQYTYRVQARDKSANQNTGSWSTSQSATTDTGVDTTPPTPNPLTWATVPYATGSSSISMTATTASDPSGVEYYFDCTGGGGHDSAWQDGAVYQDTGLDPNTQYTYRVQARDKSANQNTCGWSTTQSATTNATQGGLVGLWEFNEGSGTTAADSSDSSNDGTVNGATWTTGHSGNALSFDGVNDYVNVSTETSIANLPSGDFTVAWWQNWDQDPNESWDTILGKYQQYGWRAYLSQTSGKLTFRTSFSTSGVWFESVSDTLTADTWQHIAVVFDSNSISAKLYVNGSEVSYAAQTTGAGTYQGDSGVPLQFGRAYWDGNHFRGILDEIRIYDRALSGSEISELAGGGEDTTAPSPDPMTFATAPYATGTTSIAMVAATASDPSGVEYYFECTAGGGHNSGWQASASYMDTGLSEVTQYTYRVRARDKSANQNATAWSTTHSATTQDGTAPTPNPMTFATAPYATGTTSISMVASTASDSSGVEYYFECTAGGGSDSGWQDSTSYTDTGLSELTQYTYRVGARDKSSNQNATAWSTAQPATTQDGTAPTPNPSTWATVPYATGSTSISMTATTATDPSGVQYYFECTAGGGHDSGWQSSSTYEDTGLSPSTQYTYRTRARDMSSNNNQTSWSTTQYATTDAAPDTAPPTPDPLTWATAPYAAGATSISMIATTASDASGVEYYFECTAGGGNDSGWQDSTSYTDTGLSELTQYTYHVRARDKSANQNATGWSSTQPATTEDGTAPTPDPLTWATVPYATGATSVSMTATTASDPCDVEYYFDCTAGGGHDSAWQDSTTYEDTGLDPNTQYTYRVQARDKSTNQNTGGWSTSLSATTVSEGVSYTVFDSGFQDNWSAGSGVSVTSFGGYTCMDISGSAWSWHSISRASHGADLTGTTYFEYEIYFDSTSAGDQVEWHVTAPDGEEWNGTYQWMSPLAIDGVPDTYPYAMSQDTWHTIRLDCSNNNWWTTDCNDMRYLKWQLPEASEAYIRKVRFYSEGEADTTAPTPDPMTFATSPYAAGATSVSMVATTASDDNGVEYYFECTAGGGNDSGWQDSASYTDTGLSELTQYTYRVRARDKSSNQNATAWSTGQSATTQDGTAPTPDPMTWATAPYSNWPTSVAMVASTASDASGVEYYFDCTAGGGHDSGWQDSASYTDTGLSELTQYSYRVHARDKSSNQNATAWSTTQSATTQDGTPPAPDPMTWATVPYSTGTTSISMTATTASDPCGVQYYFECTLGGGHDSGWQSSATYEDTGLSPNTEYGYRVRARDLSPANNQTNWSTTLTATTDAVADTTAPTPDPLTWNVVPYSTGTTSISMTATSASDPSGVEYYFDCTAGGGHDSGWQDSTTYEDTGLSASTQYTYRVQARDKSANQNAGGWSTSESATTDAPPDTTAPTPNPLTWSTEPYATDTTSISMTATTASDPSGVEYYFDCVAGPGGHDSGWQDSTTYQDTGLTPSTQYTYRVQARDKSANQNTGGWSTTQSATTDTPPDTTAPTPNPLTWSTAPYATGTTSISMTATAASDPSGVGYYFDCTAGAGGHDSGWQDSTTYQDTGLSANTQYTYRVQARDKSANQNTGGWSTSQSATTDSEPSGLVGLWEMDEGSGGTVYDSSGSSNDGYISGDTAPTWTTGHPGNALSFDGVNDLVGVPTETDINDLPSGDFTVAWWQNWDQDPNESFDCILGKYEQYGWRVYLSQTSRRITFRASFTTTSPWCESVSDTLTADTWQHIAVVFDSDSISMKIYVDGSEVSYAYQVSGEGTYRGDSGTPLQFGRAYWDSNQFKGILDEVRLYNRALSGSEISALAGGGSGDTTAPTPDPLTWATVPYAAGTTSISMTATTASDASGVEYYFDCTAGGGHDSGWQDSASYTDTGLAEATQYTYRVQARDKSDNQNATAWSTTQSATTQDGTAPTPNPLTWATVPYATGMTSISMTATTASDASGVEYYFDCTAGAGGHDSGWQDSAAYQDTGLSAGIQYSYRVQARDKSANHNVGGWSTTQSATTDSAVTLLQDGFETNFDKWTDGGATDWDRTTAQKYSGSYSAHAGRSDNDLISDNLSTTGYGSITISFRYRDDDIDDSDNVYLQLYDGSSYVNRFELGLTSPEDTWHYYETTIYNSGGDAAYFISNFRIKFEGSSIDIGENLWIDDVLIIAQ